MKRIIELPDNVVEAIQSGEDYRYDIHTAIAQSTPYNLSSDLISREALKKAIDELFESGGYDSGLVMNTIDNAQSVDLWQMRQEATENALKKAREADRWIPVSERLPEPQKPNDDIYNPNCSDYVLVCIEWWNGQKVIDVACYVFDDEEWEYHGSEESEVIAWKPLPKPYEPKGGAE